MSRPAADPIVPALVLAVLIGLAAWLLLRDTLPPAPIAAGSPAPAFSLPSLDGGEKLSLAGLRGKVVLVSFWATWCKPCEVEKPAMERLYLAFQERPFELVAVSVDTGRDEVAAFRDRLGLTFAIALDPDREVARAYQSFRYPESFLIDANGVLVARYVGPRDWDAPEYQARISRLLAKGS